MKKFRFRFQTIQQLRDREEKEALKDFSNEQKKFRTEVEKKNSIIRSLENSLTRRENLAPSGAGSAHYCLEDAFILGSKVRIYQQEMAINRAEKSLRKSFRNYVDKRQKRMTMDKLREKELAAYKKEKKKQEQKELDEFYVLKGNSQGVWSQDE